MHCGEQEEGTCVQRSVSLTLLSSINLSDVFGTGTTSSNFISILSNLTNVFFFVEKKKSFKGGHLLVQKVQKPDPPTENTLVEMFRFCLNSD